MKTYPGFQYMEIKVKRGFPALFWYKINPAEPDVGIRSPYIEECFVTTKDGRHAKWLRIDKEELNELESITLESYDL